MNSQEKYATLGIDIGSTTVKIAILDEEHNILFSDYERHFANIRETLSDLDKDFVGDGRIEALLTLVSVRSATPDHPPRPPL